MLHAASQCLQDLPWWVVIAEDIGGVPSSRDGPVQSTALRRSWGPGPTDFARRYQHLKRNTELMMKSENGGHRQAALAVKKLGHSGCRQERLRFRESAQARSLGTSRCGWGGWLRRGSWVLDIHLRKSLLLGVGADALHEHLLVVSRIPMFSIRYPFTKW